MITPPSGPAPSDLLFAVWFTDQPGLGALRAEHWQAHVQWVDDHQAQVLVAGLPTMARGRGWGRAVPATPAKPQPIARAPVPCLPAGRAAWTAFALMRATAPVGGHPRALAPRP